MAELQALPGGAQARLLLADAEVHVRRATARALREKGYLVEEVASASELFARLEAACCELIVLDPALPDADGALVLKQVRERNPDAQIVVLAARASVESAIAAVRAGVVDYLVKPCPPQDLALAVGRALAEHAAQRRHRRLLDMVAQAMEALRQPDWGSAYAGHATPITVSDETPSQLLDVGVLSLDREKRLVTLKTNPPRCVELTESEVSILLALMEKPNQVLTCHQLAKHALGYEGMDKWTVENVIRSSVFRLRSKIEAGADSPRLIRTVRGRGYFLSTAS